MDARLLARDRSVEAVEKLITIMRDAAATHTAQSSRPTASSIAAMAGRIRALK